MLVQRPIIPDIRRATFFDDFVGQLYDNRIWTGTGTGSATQLSSLGGRCRIRANAAASYRVFFNAFGAFTVGANARFEILCALTPSTAAGGLVEFGFQTAATPTGNYVKFVYAPNTSAFFSTTCMSASTPTTQATDVTGNTSDHLFRIECATGEAKFYVDDVLKVTTTTNIPTGSLQPFMGGTGTTGVVSDINVDWVFASGDRP